MDTKELENLGGYNPQNNKPNEELFTITEIDGLADQISEKMDNLCDYAGDSKQQVAISKAWNKITRWQTRELKELKESFGM